MERQWCRCRQKRVRVVWIFNEDMATCNLDYRSLCTHRYNLTDCSFVSAVDPILVTLMTIVLIAGVMYTCLILHIRPSRAE